MNQPNTTAWSKAVCTATSNFFTCRTPCSCGWKTPCFSCNTDHLNIAFSNMFPDTGLAQGQTCQSGFWRKGDDIVQLGINGWSCNPRSGLIEQWGTGAGLGNDSSRYESFRHRMSAVYSATVTAINTPKYGVRGGDMGVYNLTSSGMLVTNDDYPISGYFWRVIGYSDVCGTPK